MALMAISFHTSAAAQIETFMTNQGATNTLVQCEGFFYDEGGISQPYADTNGKKMDILTLCPNDPSQQALRVTFNLFDVAPGDRLRAFNGSDTLAGVFTTFNGGSGTGSSVADSPGGSTVTASCDNIGGCVTFVFERNGDGVKGAGFEAAVRCVGRTTTKLDCSRVDQFNGGGQHLVVANCQDGKAFVKIPIPSFTDCGRLGRLNISSSCAANFPDNIIAVGTGFIETYFPIGTHTLTFSSPIYPDIKCEANIRVLSPGMGCNDDLNVSLSNGCSVVLTPDLMLEGDCSPKYITRPIDGEQVANFFYEVEFGANQEATVVGTTSNGYPIVDFSSAACGTRFDVKITRKYIADTDCDGQLFNGYDLDDEPITDICWGQIRVEDKVDPIIVESPQPIGIPCYEKNYDASNLLRQLNDLDPTQKGNGGNLDLLLSHLSINVEGADQLNILENCQSNITASIWEYVAGDCETDELSVKDIYGVDGEKSTFGFYRRVFSVKDKCSNEALASQIIYLYQPEIVAPKPEYKVPCGTDIDPEALRNNWLAWVNEGRPTNDPRQKYASFLPNFDPTFIAFSLYEVTDGSGDEVPLDALKTTCGYAIDWSDSDEIYICGGGYKLFRTWTIYDWCSGVLELTNIIPQVIQVGDEVAPEILGNLTYEIKNTASLDCGLNVEFAKPNVVDDCAGSVEVSVRVGSQTKIFVGNSVVLENLPINELLTIEWLATDECRNTKVVSDTVTLTDVVAPTAICERNRVVSLGTSCNVRIPATSFDDGSFDNCGTVSFAVAHSITSGVPEDSLFAAHIDLTIEDLDGSCDRTLEVVFRVMDGAGNVNYCTVDVELQDKLPPTALPTTQKLNCEDTNLTEWLQIKRDFEDNPTTAFERLENLFAMDASFGKIDGGDNCASADGQLDVDITNISFRDFNADCKEGKITYDYRLKDACGNVSRNIINTVEIDSKSDWTIRFPGDQVVFCDGNDDANLAPNTLEDILDNSGCDQWGLEVKEERFEDDADACYKIIYTYQLINWCTWNPSNTEIAIVERPDTLIDTGTALRFLDADQDGVNDIDDGDEDNDNIYIYTNRGPFNIRDVSEAEDFDIYDVTGAKNDGDFVIIDTGDIPYGGVEIYDLTSQFSNRVQTYVSAQEYGYFAYRQIVKVIDNGAPTVEVKAYEAFCGGEEAVNGNEACSANVEIEFSVDDICSQRESLQVSYRLKAFEGNASADDFGNLVSLGEGRFAIRGNYPLGTNGSKATHIFVVRVEDACNNTAEEEIIFEVKDCKAPVTVCQQALSTSMSEEGLVTLQSIDFDAGSVDFCTPKSQLKYTFADPSIYPDSTSRTFRCDAGEIGTISVNFWVQDLAGNASFCEAFVNISPYNDNGCSGANYANVGGLIATEENLSIAEVEVRLSGSDRENSMTDEGGSYHFDRIEMGYDYSITPSKEDNLLQGVSTYDMILMSKHILNIERLDSPYKILAADVNHSGDITTADMLALRKVILGQEDEFSNNTSWRFIPTDFVFPNWGNPWETEFPENINLNDIETDQPTVDFTGIKIGDVNSTAMNNGSNIENRSMVELRSPKSSLNADETYNLPIFLDDLANVKGLQMTLQFDVTKLKLVDIKEGVLKYYHIGTDRLKEGIILVSWIAENEQTVANLPLLTLQLQARETTQLKQALSLTSNVLATEAYLSNDAFAAMDWTFEEVNQQAYQLHQNQPNPFNDNTQITFELPESCDVQLEIFHLNGQRIFTTEKNYEAGQHQWMISAELLPSDGVYYYRLRTANYSSSRKMIFTK